MKDAVKVWAPATVANIGCGYDTIGFALEGIYEELTVSRRSDDQLVIKSIEGATLSLNADENVATIAVKALLTRLGSSQGFDFHIKKLFLPGSGLGSSASSAAGAVYAANQLLPEPLSTAELLPFALEGEAYASKSYHADNVAPSLLGGCIAIRSYDPLDYFSVPIAEELSILIARPFAQVKTAEAKQLLPKVIDIATARDQWGNLASLIQAFHEKDWNRLKSSIQDYIAEPVRKGLIPGYDEMRAIASGNGCVGFNISGSGPSVFMFFEDEKTRSFVKNEIKTMFENKEVSCDFFETKMSPKGCHIVE